MSQARRRGVHGWVRNRRDGSVEALLHGAAAALADLLQLCRAGPPHARVDDLADLFLGHEESVCVELAKERQLPDPQQVDEDIRVCDDDDSFGARGHRLRACRSESVQLR